MNYENQFPNPALEQAVSEIRQESVDPVVVEAAAARVWARLQAVAEHQPVIRNCEDFQALIPDFRAHQLTEARALLLQDHLHQCVVCRRVYEGRVVSMPEPKPRPAAVRYPVRWVAAAAVVAAAGVAIWIAVDQHGAGAGRAIVQTVTGTLYEVSAAGIRPLAAGQDLRDGVEIRTAPDADAMLQLRDGSVVELRERSGMSTESAARDLTIHLTRGSVIVAAAKRRAGHLYVATAECRVSVTGTLFSVSAGVKGSRVSVLQGEVHVSQDNQDKILHPGDQSVSGEGLEAEPVREDISWSRNRDQYFALLAALRSGIDSVPLPDLRYSSNLIGRLPANTMLYAAVPNLAEYLGAAESVFRQKLAENPTLAMPADKQSGPLAVLDKLRAAGKYLGDEIVMAGFQDPANANHQGVVFFAEVKLDGFPGFLKQTGLPLAVESRNGLVVFGPDRADVAAFAPAMDAPSGGFQATPFYRRIEETYRDGAGLLFCLDLSSHAPDAVAGARYLIAEQKEVNHHMEARATLAFDSERHGMAAWLAEPAPMGSLEYFTPDTAFAAAFVVRQPAAIVDELGTVVKGFGLDLGPGTAPLRQDLSATLGGEFALALDGPAIPVPSWKLVVEVYDSARFQTALQKVVDAYNRQTAKTGGKPVRTAQESVDGRTYYLLAGGDPNPLTEAHYTFVDGYLIAAPSRTLVTHALEARTSRISLLHSSQFISLAPRDHYANFSGMIYQNLAPTIGPIAGLLDSFLPKRGEGHAGIVQGLAAMKPSLIAAYGEPDRLTVATGSNLFSGSLTDVMTGNLSGIVGRALPLPMMMGHRRAPVPVQ
jgi:ferric-dicitrate binding protein FerR (iron transport regulator)